MYKVKGKLPDKPSELILLALTDLAWVEKNKKYKVNMGMWHMPLLGGPCSVCFAGAVMSRETNIPITANANLESFDKDVADKFDALDEIRQGQIENFFQSLGIERPSNIPDLYHHRLGARAQDRSGSIMFFPQESLSYAYDKKEWWLHMQTIVGILQAEGL